MLVAMYTECRPRVGREMTESLKRRRMVRRVPLMTRGRSSSPADERDTRL